MHTQESRAFLCAVLMPIGCKVRNQSGPQPLALHVRAQTSASRRLPALRKCNPGWRVACISERVV